MHVVQPQICGMSHLDVTSIHLCNVSIDGVQSLKTDVAEMRAQRKHGHRKRSDDASHAHGEDRKHSKPSNPASDSDDSTDSVGPANAPTTDDHTNAKNGSAHDKSHKPSRSKHHKPSKDGRSKHKHKHKKHGRGEEDDDPDAYLTHEDVQWNIRYVVNTFKIIQMVRSRVTAVNSRRLIRSHVCMYVYTQLLSVPVFALVASATVSGQHLATTYQFEFYEV